MSEAESSSLASLISSLLESFRTVPPTAIPPLLDCVLASTGLSPSSLFDSLSDRLVDSVGGVKDKKLDSESCARITGMLVAVCHLLEKVGANHESLWLFTWRSFLPLMKMGHELDREFLNQVADLFFGVVEKTNTWDFLEENLVPVLLRSAFFSDGIVRDDESDALLLEMPSAFGPNNNSCVDKDSKLYLEESLPLALSCFLLRGTLDAALGSIENASSGDLFQEKGSGGAERLVVTLLWDLCLLTEQLLLKSSEQRSCTICFLLPIIFKTFASHGPLNVTINGKTNELSRNSFFMKIWACCRTLFSLGSSERRDAYGLLSLFLSLIPSSEISKDAEISNQPEVFDIKTVKEFWNEMKKGLMSDDGLVRKQSLYILKTVLFIEGGSQCDSQFSENKTSGKHSVSHGMTKRDLWADKEAKSLGVGKFCNVSELAVSSKQQWEAFLLLYEMLEEYGTHLVEAAWNPQITLLLQFSLSHDNFVSAISRGAHLDEKEILDEALSWLSILWKRGFCHDNPQVRCMILQSFLGIDWGRYESCAKSMPESFILGPFLDALDDPVHHSDFGVKGVYSSKTIEGAVNFFHQFAADLDTRRRIAFSRNVAALTKTRSFSRPGLMSLAECIASFGFGSGKINGTEAKFREDAIHDKLQEQYYGDKCLCNDKTDLVGVLRYVIESCKQHFNPNYRLRVCKDVLKAVASLVCVIDVPLEIILHFISALPREFTNNGGLLRTSVQYWLIGNKKHQTAYSDEIHMQFLEKLSQFPRIFISHNGLDQSFNDEDLNAWELEAKRWTRVLLLVAREGHNLAPVLEFIENCCVTTFEQNNQSECMPEKFLILISCLIHEIDEFKEGTAKCVSRAKRTEVCLAEGRDHAHEEGASAIYKKFSEPLLLILEKLLPFAYLCCSVFWSRPEVEIAVLPSSVRGKLGGPSQRRLPNSITTAVLKAIISVKVVAYISWGYAQYGGDSLLQSARSFLWEFFQKTVSCPTCNSETEAEVRLATYEVLAPVLKAFVTLLSPGALHLVRKTWKSLPVVVEGELWVDSLVLSFLQNVNNLLSVGAMVRTRRAVLLNWKWLCLESLLLIPTCAEQKGLQASGGSVFFSDTAVRHILTEVTESLENAGEVSVLPMLRSLRMALELVASGRFYSAGSAFEAFDTQMIWQLVHSSWILHVNCSKRRVAPIAALLSSILHSSLFSEEDMHVSNDGTGPLKWFVGKLLEEGSKSPRTIRLVALHLTGLWLLNPWTIKYYMKELKLLTLYGSVAFDEDFEAELAESHDSRIEVSLLAKSPDSELTEAFINTELYSRVSVAVLFQKLAALTFVVTASVERKRSQAALPSGKLFLLELMDLVVNDKDLAKELYKKYSAIHRRKVRAWQMICVLSPFVSDDIVDEVTRHLHVALYRNNLPGVRQYLETFGINICLKFPLLVGEQLVPILRDYDMRPQALASYVFIAANVMLHAPNTVKFRHLDELFPPIIPFLTSHHHSLRGFTQVLVHQVLKRLFPAFDSENAKAMSLEKQCFQDLNLYLENNSDCMRLRSSMEGYLDAYDPKFSVTPAGIFVARAEETGFECVPTSLMEHVLNFLNDAREGLRSSMARDTVKIKNESFDVGEAISFREMFSSGLKEKSLADPYKELMLDYQKKVTLSKHDKEDSCSSDSLWNVGTYKQLLEMEKEDDLLDQLLKSRIVTMEKIRGKRQSFILVASLLDRIPNLAGLARTCEVFRASGLAVADTNVVHDKQFQLISVTAEKWVPIIEVPVSSMKLFLEKKKREGFSILGLEQTANSIPLDQFVYPKKTVMVLGHEKEGIPADVIHILDACIEIPQLGVVRSLNVHVSGAIALWEYTRQQRSL